MCNALWAICYSSIASMRYWTEWDLNRVLTLGNDLYISLGYTSQYLALDDLPNLIATENGHIQIEKSDSYLFELSRNSTSFLRAHEYANGGIIVAGSFRTSYISCNGVVYVFDSHSRDLLGLPHNSGTSVLLKFNSTREAESYIKYLYLSHFQNERLFCDLQHFNINITDAEKTYLQKTFQKGKINARKSENATRINWNLIRTVLTKLSDKMLNPTEKDRFKKAALNASLSKEKIKTLNEKKRVMMADFRANLSTEEKEILNKKIGLQWLISDQNSPRKKKQL
ncbi:uncharacterized protein LOC130647191 [Hydractinia symbiolongicarpus]|uniref:uncharacterized protein LOC130647191 n=1 Tax=Hydractinia symbiolongicarpus TaxID=13093 RepID=UPI00254E9B84|nr:uncharacterized protein LOC130647191 [Hydractinia symbiolongicarpus]